MRKILFAAVACVLLVAPATATASGPWDYLLAPESACPGQSNPALPEGAQERIMVCMHDWARAQQGFPPLLVQKRLHVSSHRKAHDILRCQQFSHEACGRSAFFWVRRSGFETGRYAAGENLAFGQGSLGTPRAIMSDWLNSDVHRAIVLMPIWRNLGITVLHGKLNGHPGIAVWVAHFGYHRR